MIAKLSGTVDYKDLSFAVIDVHGVGYKVFMTGSFLVDLTAGQQVTIHTHTAIRENSQELYGFRTREELKFFELLISISGIGPKTALGILNVTTIETLKQAVYSEDITHLTRVSGIGRKIAEKILIELRGKFASSDIEELSTNLRGDVDVLDALQSMGFTQKESQEALKKIPKDIESTSEKIKYVLKTASKS